MRDIKPKHYRTITRVLSQLESAKSYYVPKCGKDFPRQMEFILRNLAVGGGKTIFLTDSGKEALFCIVDMLDQADLFPGEVSRDDILNVVRNLLQCFLQQKKFPSDTQEFL